MGSAIVPDLNIFVFSNTIVDFIWEAPWYISVYYVGFICITWRGKGSASFVCNQHCVVEIDIVTDEFTILILQKYGFKVWCIPFGFYSSHFILYIHLPWMNTQRQTTATFSSQSPFSLVSLLYWYYKNRVLRFVCYSFVLILLVLNFIYIYPEEAHSRKNSNIWRYLSHII